MGPSSYSAERSYVSCEPDAAAAATYASAPAPVGSTRHASFLGVAYG
jgi:hypothetical protein